MCQLRCYTDFSQSAGEIVEKTKEKNSITRQGAPDEALVALIELGSATSPSVTIKKGLETSTPGCEKTTHVDKKLNFQDLGVEGIRGIWIVCVMVTVC